MSNKKIADVATFDITIPEQIENLQLPNPELLLQYKDLQERTLWIDDDISSNTLEFAKYIIQWNREDKDLKVKDRVPIKILFFSYGGDLDVNNVLVDTISLSKTPIIGINCGQAASAACFIYLSCHKRYTFPNASFLIHQGAGDFSGTYEQVCAAVASYQAQIEYLGEYVLSRTNIDDELFYENYSSDWYIGAEDAVTYGIALKIVKSLDEIF